MKSELNLLHLQMAALAAYPVLATAMGHLNEFKNNKQKDYIKILLGRLTDEQLDAIEKQTSNRDYIRISTLAKQLFLADMTQIEDTKRAMTTAEETIYKMVELSFLEDYMGDKSIVWRLYQEQVSDARKALAFQAGIAAARGGGN